MMQAAMVPNNSIRAYMILDDVELRHEGHAAQHNEHAVLPQQHASYKSIKIIAEWWILQGEPYRNGRTQAQNGTHVVSLDSKHYLLSTREKIVSQQ
jgi:hypothetical protein